MIGLKTISSIALGLAIGSIFTTAHTRWMISDLNTRVTELDAKIGVTDGKHDSSLEYLLDKHAIHEAEIASLKKRLSKKPASH